VNDNDHYRSAQLQGKWPFLPPSNLAGNQFTVIRVTGERTMNERQPNEYFNPIIQQYIQQHLANIRTDNIDSGEVVLQFPIRKAEIAPDADPVEFGVSLGRVLQQLPKAFTYDDGCAMMNYYPGIDRTLRRDR
jgi:hypothetical protein